MKKQLTITIPAYNAEKYIRKCLDSLTGEGDFKGVKDLPDNRMEILVINDGSSDRTGEIAGSYEEKYPEIVRVISKENGGHGSGINAGISRAEGRYFKVIDADDWAVTENIRAILDQLEQTDSDVVVTGYQTYNEKNGKTLLYNTAADKEPVTESLPEFAKHFEQTPAAFQFHGLCYKTAFFKNLGIPMSEGVYYEDQEYAVLPFLKADTIAVFPQQFYVYRLGRGDQSVSFQKMEKSMRDMQTVLKKLISYYEKEAASSGFSPERKLFFGKRLSIAVTSYYSAAFVKAKNKKAGREAAEQFRQYLQAADPSLEQMVSGKYETLRKAGKIPGLASVYSLFSETEFFLNFKKKWNQ